MQDNVRLLSCTRLKMLVEHFFHLKHVFKNELIESSRCSERVEIFRAETLSLLSQRHQLTMMIELIPPSKRLRIEFMSSQSLIAREVSLASIRSPSGLFLHPRTAMDWSGHPFLGIVRDTLQRSRLRSSLAFATLVLSASELHLPID